MPGPPTGRDAADWPLTLAPGVAGSSRMTGRSSSRLVSHEPCNEAPDCYCPPHPDYRPARSGSPWAGCRLLSEPAESSRSTSGHGYVSIH